MKQEGPPLMEAASFLVFIEMIHENGLGLEEEILNSL